MEGDNVKYFLPEYSRNFLKKN